MWYLNRISNTPTQPVKLSEVFRIGRAKKADLCCPVLHISRTHSEIYIVGEKVYIKDLKSSNGVFVNGLRISNDVKFEIKENDIIGFGTTDIEDTGIQNYIYRLIKFEPQNNVQITDDDVPNRINKNKDVFAFGTVIPTSNTHNSKSDSESSSAQLRVISHNERNRQTLIACSRTMEDSGRGSETTRIGTNVHQISQPKTKMHRQNEDDEIIVIDDDADDDVPSCVKETRDILRLGVVISPSKDVKTFASTVSNSRTVHKQSKITSLGDQRTKQKVIVSMSGDMENTSLRNDCMAPSAVLTSPQLPVDSNEISSIEKGSLCAEKNKLKSSSKNLGSEAAHSDQNCSSRSNTTTSDLEKNAMLSNITKSKYNSIEKLSSPQNSECDEPMFNDLEEEFDLKYEPLYDDIVLSNIKTEMPNNSEFIPTYDIDDEEDDSENVWRQRLSQSIKSPPPEIDDAYSNQWWPDLSQSFFESQIDENLDVKDEFEATDSIFIKTELPNRTRSVEQIVTLEKDFDVDRSELSNIEHTVQRNVCNRNEEENIENECVTKDESKRVSTVQETRISAEILTDSDLNNSVSSKMPVVVLTPLNKLQLKLHKKQNNFKKPPIIEPPMMLNCHRPNLKRKLSDELIDQNKKQKKRVSDPKNRASNLKVKARNTHKKAEKLKAEKKPSKILLETRKQKLKILAEKESSKSSLDKVRSATSKPKVKVTLSNRSDALAAALTLDATKPTKKSNSTTNNIKFKIPIRRSSLNKTVEGSNEKITAPNNKTTQIQLPEAQLVVKESNVQSKITSHNTKTGTLSKNQSAHSIGSESPVGHDSISKQIPINTQNREAPVENNDKTPLVKQLKPILKEFSSISVNKRVSWNLTPNVRYIEREIVSANKNPELVAPSNICTNSRLKVSVNMNTVHHYEVIWFCMKWEPEWLFSDKRVSCEELCNSFQLRPIVPIFNHYDHYYQTFFPLMLLELWTIIKKEWDIRKFMKYNFCQTVVDKHEKSTDYIIGDKCLTKMNCKGIISNTDFKMGKYPHNGELAVLDVLETGQKIFGFINSSFKVNNDEMLALSLGIKSHEPTVTLQLTIFIKNDINYQFSNRVNIRSILNMFPHLRPFIGLYEVPRSPLLHNILCPTFGDYRLPFCNPEKLFTNHPLNPSQHKAVFSTVAACLRPEPKISLIIGPPGSGKSFVIQNIILQLLYGDSRHNLPPHNAPRLLLCAPSNAALDQITRSLLDIRSKIINHRFKMVRIGNSDTAVRNITARKLAENLKMKTIQNFEEQLKQQEALKVSFVQQLEVARSRNKDITEANRNLINSSRRAETLSQLLKDAANRHIYEYEYEILYRADIICTTLNSCYSQMMERLAKDQKFRFTCAIIDEASQATEPDTLIPLILGINTLVLVGDTYQLPALVLSQEAKSIGYCNSLMGRLRSSLNSVEAAPITLLNIQYRMHPEISKWPNSYMYKNFLHDDPKLIESRRSVLQPYKLFIHKYKQQFEENIEEAQLIIKMIIIILQLTKMQMRIGIIAPYQKQRQKITRMWELESNRFPQSSVEVNTIDSFQGQERDVIILSCVRTDGIGFLVDCQRLNVALTRARNAMYIVVNFNSLNNSPMWNSIQVDAAERKCTYYCVDNIGMDTLTAEIQRQL